MTVDHMTWEVGESRQRWNTWLRKVAGQGERDMKRTVLVE
jgi:hypothetical protein